MLYCMIEQLCCFVASGVEMLQLRGTPRFGVLWKKPICATLSASLRDNLQRYWERSVGVGLKLTSKGEESVRCAFSLGTPVAITEALFLEVRDPKEQLLGWVGQAGYPLIVSCLGPDPVRCLPLALVGGILP